MKNEIEELEKTFIDRTIELFLAIQLLIDSRNLVLEGKKYHITAIYGQLRAILTDNTQKKNQGALLIYLARVLIVELKFYYNPLLSEYLSLHSTDTVLAIYELDLSMQKQLGRHKEITLDEFLEKNILIYRGKNYTMKSIIDKLSNKLGGAHYDPTIPKDISDLTNIQWGDIPLLDNYLLKFVDVLVPLSTIIPKFISDCDIWLAIIQPIYPKERICLYNLTLSSRYFQISIFEEKEKLVLSITDLVNNQIEIELTSKLELDNLNILSVSHIVQDDLKSAFLIYLDNKLVETHIVQPLLLFNDIRWCNLVINKLNGNKIPDFEYGVYFTNFFDHALLIEERTEIIKNIKEHDNKCLIIKGNNYATYNCENYELKRMKHKKKTKNMKSFKTINSNTINSYLLSKSNGNSLHNQNLHNSNHNSPLKSIFLYVLFLSFPLIGNCQCDKYVKKINDRFEDKPLFETIKSIKLDGGGFIFEVKLKRDPKDILFGEYKIDFQTDGIISTFWNVDEIIFLFEDNTKFLRSKSDVGIIVIGDSNFKHNSNQARHFMCSLITNSKYLDFDTLSRINKETQNQFRHKALIAIRFKTSDGQVDIDLTKEQSTYFIEVFNCMEKI